MPTTPSRPAAPEPFDYQPLGRVVFGPGTLVPARRAGPRPGRHAASCSSPIPAWKQPATRSGRCESLRAAGLAVAVFDDVEENPTGRHVEAAAAVARAAPGRPARGRRRRQRHGRGQGDQLRRHQRRLDRRLPGLRQGDQADAAVDRRADHGRHRQRGPVVRPDRRRVEPPEDGLRRQEGRLPHRRPRSRSDADAAADGDGRHRHRLGRPRRRELRLHAGGTPCRRRLPGRRGTCSTATSSGCWTGPTTWPPGPTCSSGRTSAAWRSRRRCSAAPTPAPTR